MKKLLLFVALLAINISFGQESLTIDWPKEAKLKIASDQADGPTHMVELIPEKETFENWTLMGNMMAIKGVKVQNTAQIAELFKQSALQNAPESKMTIIESDDTVKNIWVLFKIESPKFNDDPNPESQLYYAIQGDESLHVNFIAIKKKKLDDTFIEKWSKVFKASQLVKG
ncbi:hypothetical protein HYN59_05410 [Flavobacterium album]|uniref:SRPBCC domain-containing protein n=1 Tax=Flavobacterium album TaxID=2175091 RepID=A0A2S1QVY6_9FLAO|nr:hypothetical protein [Flavobacterium album]AWH84590.1 hypothetical protein HYN59_05410 [Flavobacterium album]